MGIVSPSNHDLLVNTLGFGIPALVFFALRMVNAIYIMGKFHKDDIAMVITIFFYISLLVLINVSGRFATNLYPPEQAAQILSDPQDVNSRIIGSKIVIALEQCMLASTWGAKICILMFIDRLVTLVRTLYIMVRVATLYVILGYIMVQVTYYGLVCRPFSQYWAMPVSNSECATYSTYSKVQMVFNISSDLWLIMIPLYMTWTCSLPLRRKAVLTLVFSLAIFTIIAAVLNKVYNFASPWTTIYQIWYIRESSVAVLVANIICCWQLLQKIFKVRSFDNSTPNIQAVQTFGVVGGNRQVTDPEMVTEGGTYMNKSWWDRRFAREGGMFSTFKSRLTGKTKNDKTANGDNSTIEEELGPRGRTRTARGSAIFVDPLRSHASERFSLGSEGHEALQYRSLNDLS